MHVLVNLRVLLVFSWLCILREHRVVLAMVFRMEWLTLLSGHAAVLVFLLVRFIQHCLFVALFGDSLGEP